jgi:hypothetical protein
MYEFLSALLASRPAAELQGDVPAGEGGLQVAANLLFALDGLEEGFEVALTEAE